jgi:hypothetical protein
MATADVESIFSGILHRLDVVSVSNRDHAFDCPGKRKVRRKRGTISYLTG